MAGTETFESGNFDSHTFDKEVVLEKYLKAEADCDNPATYYKSCKCGEKGTVTFTYGTSKGHIGGVATCTNKAICERCSQPYGTTKTHSYVKEVVADKYLKSAADCQGPARYYKSCECGLAGTAFFEYGAKTDHEFNQKNTNDIYLVTPASCTESATYVYSCKCGEKGTETFEMTGASGHTYSTTWSSDADKHWYECSKCGNKKSEAAHIAGPAATEQNAQTCTVCNYIIAPALAHKHNYSTTLTGNMSGHWYACSGCSDRKDFDSHKFDSLCDPSCSECGYERGILHTYGSSYKTTDSMHWHECTNCGQKINEGEHIAGPEATEYESQKCVVCKYVITPALNHEHGFVEDSFDHDEEEHWNQCECGEHENKAPHDFEDVEVILFWTQSMF